MPEQVNEFSVKVQYRISLYMFILVMVVGENETADNKGQGREAKSYKKLFK